MKKTVKKALALSMTAALFMTACSQKAAETPPATAGGDTGTAATEAAAAATEGKSKAERPVAGMTCYMYSDTHIANVRNTVLKAAETGTVSVETSDSQFDVGLQMNAMDAFVTKGCKYLVINNINTNAKDQVIDVARKADLPIIFWNTDSPSDEEMDSYGPCYFVSSAAEQSGVVQGEAAAKYWKEHPEADRNGNGKMDYVMLMGQIGNYDTEMRTKYSIDTVKEAGVETNCLLEVVCEWQRAKAQDQMASVISANADDIDIVFANNDDMALGAIEALKAAGYFTDESNYIPVLGVDTTKVGLQALEDGTMLATSLNNPVTMGKCIYKILELLEAGEEITSENLGYDIDEHKRVWLDYVAITKDNLEDADLSKYE